MKWRILALMTAAQAGASIVQQALGSLSPVIVGAFGLTKAQLGVVFTAMMLGSASCTALAGALTDRWGERTMTAVAGVAMTLALAGAALAGGYPALVIAMAVFGAAYAASTPAGGRAVLAWFDRDRGLAMGIRQTGVPVGGTFGAIVLPVVARAYGLHGAFAFAAVIVALSSAVTVVLYRAAADAERASHTMRAIVRGMRTLARDPRLLGVTGTCMVLVSVQLAMNAFVTVTGVAVVGTSAAFAAGAFAVAQGAAAAGRLWWGFASDRFFGGDRLVPFAIICGIAAVAAAGFALLARGAVVPFVVFCALLGVAGAGWNGLMAAALAEVGGLDRAASALGLALTAIFVASALAPLAFGSIADHLSMNVAWGCTSVLALAGVAPVLWLRAHLDPGRSATAEG